jgi:hypothetical protein
MKQAPHLPYSPDLAPSGFFLFGAVKGQPMGYRAETPFERIFSRMDGAIAKMHADRW